MGHYIISIMKLFLFWFTQLFKCMTTFLTVYRSQLKYRMIKLIAVICCPAFRNKVCYTNKDDTSNKLYVTKTQIVILSMSLLIIQCFGKGKIKQVVWRIRTTHKRLLTCSQNKKSFCSVALEKCVTEWQHYIPFFQNIERRIQKFWRTDG